MSFDNKGRIGPAAGPEGHTHSIYQLNDISAAGVDNQVLVLSNGVWVPQTAVPYSMAVGRTAVTLVSGSPWSTGTEVVDLTEEPWNSPFTLVPTFTLTPGPTGTTGPLLAQYNYTLATHTLTIRLSFYGASTAAIAVSWHGIQTQRNSNAGAVSTNPEQF